MDENRQNEFNRLVADLEQGDESARRYAAEDLEYGGFSEAIPYLASGLGDPSVAVAEACAAGLIRLGGVKAAEAVVGNLASEDVRLRNLSSEVLSKLGDVAVPVLAVQLQSPDRDVRKFAVDSLLDIRSEASKKALVVALDDDDVNISATAADGLGEIGNSDHLEILSTYLSAPDEWMRCAVIRGITTIGGVKALRLVKHYLKAEEMVVRITCIQGIGKLHFAEAATEMIEQLKGGNLDFYGGEMASALSRIVAHLEPEEIKGLNSQGIEGALAEVAQEGSEDHRLEAIGLFGILGIHSGASALISLLADPSESIREAAIEALGQIKQNDLGPYERILTEEGHGLAEREAALRVAGRMGRSAEHLFKTGLSSKDPETLAATLRNLPPELGLGLVNDLGALISNGQGEVRLAAAEALANAKLDLFVGPLVAQLKVETEPDVKDALDNALLQIASEHDHLGIGAYVQSFTPEERTIALERYGFENPAAHLDKIVAALSDEHPHLRVISLKVLANLRQLTYEQIEQGVADSEPSVQVEAVRGLGSLRPDGDLAAFVAKLAQPGQLKHERVNVELIQQVVQAGIEGATELLKPFLHSPSDWVKIEAVEAFKLLGDASVLEELKSMLDGAEEDLLDALEQAIYELE